MKLLKAHYPAYFDVDDDDAPGDEGGASSASAASAGSGDAKPPATCESKPAAAKRPAVFPFEDHVDEEADEAVAKDKKQTVRDVGEGGWRHCYELV